MFLNFRACRPPPGPGTKVSPPRFQVGLTLVSLDEQLIEGRGYVADPPARLFQRNQSALGAFLHKKWKTKTPLGHPRKSSTKWGVQLVPSDLSITLRFFHKGIFSAPPIVFSVFLFARGSVNAFELFARNSVSPVFGMHSSWPLWTRYARKKKYRPNLHFFMFPFFFRPVFRDRCCFSTRRPLCPFPREKTPESWDGFLCLLFSSKDVDLFPAHWPMYRFCLFLGPNLAREL